MGAAVLALALAGCAGPVDQIVKDEAMRGELVGKIVADTTLAREFMQSMLATDAGRGVVLTHVMQDGASAQVLMFEMAKSQTMLDGLLNVAVQDPAMKTHLMTLFRGMEMAEVGTP
jgi:hypothetical protein